ncbi:unnamed protein product [Rotaria sordida]|uniref:Uncharacterized protein n=1 Tax=Rotaria sordida TaxID=392033 RepID=A0A816A9Q3_9BILA|nr:unnamed protein product [Rotaria sordida]CAF1595240.1 unnamed protein product [Rotaria sordida]
MDIHNDLSSSHKGHTEVNQLEDLSMNDSPLPDSTRTHIIELAHNGMHLCDISRCLRVSNHCVSEVLAHYYETGSIKLPVIEGSKSRVVEADVVEKIVQYKCETPSIFAWEIRLRLLVENICNSENIPSVSSIIQVLRNLESKSIDTETSSNTYLTSGDSNSEYKYQINDTNHGDLGVVMKFTQEQIDALEAAFNCTHYLDVYQREKLSQKMHLSEARIQLWFSNRRAKYHRENKVKGRQPHQSKLPFLLRLAEKTLFSLDTLLIVTDVIVLF